jgi:signal transduction histidine kinase
MTAAPRAPLVKRVPPGVWMVLLWCAAIACTLSTPRLPGLPLIGPRLQSGGSFSSVCWQLIAPGAVMILSAVLLRRRPLAALAVLLAGSLAAAAVPSPVPVVFLPVVPVGIAVCVIAAARPWRVSAGCAAVAVVMLCGRNATLGLPVRALSAGTLAVWLVIALAVAVAWLTGYAIGQNRCYAEELRAHAVTTERLRIAREVHDMVAHSIGIIAIQAGAGSRVIDTQPAMARDALSVIEATSRQTLPGSSAC